MFPAIDSERRRKGDDLLIPALVQGMSQVAAAQFAGVSERTVRRRLQDPDFNQQITRERDLLIKQTASQLTGLYPKAVEALADSLESDSGHVRLRAVRLVIELGSDLRDRVELESRLAEVEQQQRGEPGSRTGQSRSELENENSTVDRPRSRMRLFTFPGPPENHL